MNISFLCKSPFEIYSRYNRYRPATIVPGKDIEIPSELISKFGAFGHTVKDMPSDQVLLVDTRWARLRIVSDDCQFTMPANDNEWEVAKSFYKELAKRRVLVVSEAGYKCPDLLGIKAKCRKSFYSPIDGILINKKFESGDLTPEKMAEAGIKFVGDALSDTTECYFHPSHQISEWSETDRPISRHYEHYGCLCIEKVKYKIPVLSDAHGQIIPVQPYKVYIRNDNFSSVCHDAFLITHSGAPIKIAPWSDIMSMIDDIRLAVVESSISEARDTGNATGAKYFELLKESVILTHFSSLLRDCECVKHDFISQLQKYKTELLAPADIATADGLLAGLSSCSVLTEVEDAVNKLVAPELVKQNAIRLGFLPAATHKAISSSMELVATKELQELADSYQKRYFIDDFFNGLVKDGTLGCLFTSDYFNSSKRNETLMSLLAKGTEFLQLLVRNSEVIRELLEPYMCQQLETR